MKVLVLLMVAVVVAGCSTSASYDRPESYYAGTESDSDRLGGSEDLFGDGALLSDDDIARILAYRLKLQPKNRIAVLKLSRDNYWQFYSNDFNQLTESISSKFLGRLMASSRVYDASFLPSMLVPEKRTVPYLREAAARYQADLLLVYRSSCQSYQKYRFLSAHESKAYCSVEAAILDVRKGIVPFTAVSTNEYAAVETKADINFSETRKKAELESIAVCLGEVAGEVAHFLEQAE